MKALSLDEFLYCLVTIAAMRHVIEAANKPCATVAHAVTQLFESDILPRIDADTLLPDPNHFRQQHCYCEAVDTVLRAHEQSLRVLFAALQNKRGPAKRLLAYEVFLGFLRKLDLVQVRKYYMVIT